MENQKVIEKVRQRFAALRFGNCHMLIHINAKKPLAIE